MHSLGLRVQDTQPSQACNGRQGTAGQDQTLKMNEGFFLFSGHRAAWDGEREGRQAGETQSKTHGGTLNIDVLSDWSIEPYVDHIQGDPIDLREMLN